jgi:cyclopropane-fatty-acyl-phospholipid synthase
MTDTTTRDRSIEPYLGPQAPQENCPGLFTPPRAPIKGAIARRVVLRAIAGLPVRVEFPDGTSIGAGGVTDPRIVIHRPSEFYARLGADAKIGFGEAYMAGDWDAGPNTDLADLLTPFARNLTTLVPKPLQRLRGLVEHRQPATERPTRAQARENIRRHYDLSNELFASFLDESLSYSSALFEEGDDLLSAQRRKIDAVLDRAGVRPGCALLEIGTGWGELAIQAARRGAQVTSITLSTEQRDLALRRVAAAGVSDRVRILLADYRDITGHYDAIVSVEMIEAVGLRYWPVFFATLDRLLRPGGSIGLQSITMPHDRMLATRNSYTWIHKYIFPGGIVPSVEAIERTIHAHTSLAIVDRRDFGADYATTLRSWRQTFLTNWPMIAGDRFDPAFRRMWEFYLAYSEAGFRAGHLGVSQFSLTRKDSTLRSGSRPAAPEPDSRPTD